MDTKLTGILKEGDTRGIKEWVEKQVGPAADRNNGLAEIKKELFQIRLTIDQMHKKIDRIEKILEKAAE